MSRPEQTNPSYAAVIEVHDVNTAQRETYEIQLETNGQTVPEFFESQGLVGYGQKVHKMYYQNKKNKSTFDISPSCYEKGSTVLAHDIIAPKDHELCTVLEIDQDDSSDEDTSEPHLASLSLAELVVYTQGLKYVEVVFSEDRTGVCALQLRSTPSDEPNLQCWTLGRLCNTLVLEQGKTHRIPWDIAPKIADSERAEEDKAGLITESREAHCVEKREEPFFVVFGINRSRNDQWAHKRPVERPIRDVMFALCDKGDAFLYVKDVLFHKARFEEIVVGQFGEYAKPIETVERDLQLHRSQLTEQPDGNEGAEQHFELAFNHPKNQDALLLSFYKQKVEMEEEKKIMDAKVLEMQERRRKIAAARESRRKQRLESSGTGGDESSPLEK